MWRNWQTRWVQDPVGDNPVEVRVLSWVLVFKGLRRLAERNCSLLTYFQVGKQGKIFSFSRREMSVPVVRAGLGTAARHILPIAARLRVTPGQLSRANF